MTDDQFNQIIKRFDSLIAIVATREVAGMTKSAAISMLNDAGLNAELIGQITGAAKQTIYNAISDSKKKDTKKL